MITVNDATTNTSTVGRAGEHRTLRRPYRRATTLAVVAGCLVVATTGCSASLRHNYSTFQSALERGASCSELFDQRERFSDPETLAKVDADLAGIGCTSPDATRNDR
jgi:hypothetical protein